MPKSPEYDDEQAGDLAFQRYRLLIEAIARHENHQRGWISEASRRLGVHRSFISSIMRGERKTVGRSAIQKAVETFPIHSDFFFNPREDDLTVLEELMLRPASHPVNSGIGAQKKAGLDEDLERLSLGALLARKLIRDGVLGDLLGGPIAYARMIQETGTDQVDLDAIVHLASMLAGSPVMLLADEIMDLGQELTREKVPDKRRSLEERIRSYGGLIAQELVRQPRPDRY